MSTPNEHPDNERAELGNSTARRPHPKPPQPDEPGQTTAAQPGYQAPSPQAGQPLYETPTPPPGGQPAGFGGPAEPGPHHGRAHNSAEPQENSLLERLTSTGGLPPEIKYSYYLWAAVALLGVLVSVISAIALGGVVGSLGVAAAVVAVLVAVAVGLLYIFLAVRMKEGATWARIALSVIAGLNVVFLVINLTGGSIEWVASLAAVIAGVLMWLPNSRSWFAGRRTLRAGAERPR